ncbi:MAG TPA: serine hydrolase domain-containing protein [Acidobacteriaceae bacterium]
MRLLFLAGILSATIALTPCAHSQQAIHRLDGHRLSADKADAIADAELKRDGVMGAQLAIFNHGRVVWTHAYGLRNAEKNLPMTPDTNIWAASITKGVFATWVMHLAEQHRVDLDQPIAQMLAHPLNEYEPYRQSATDLVQDPQWQRVTPRILLAHSSGLSNFVIGGEPDKKLRLHFPPGTRFAYSGEGLNLLQFALEEKLHEPLDTAMQRDLFTPFGMNRTGMVWHDDFAANTALRYDAAGHYIGTTHRDRARAAGSMSTTIQNLSRFIEALLADKILQPPAKAAMFTPQVTIRAAHQFPTFDSSISDEGPHVGLAYGLGWGLLTRTPYGSAFFKEGHGDGAENYLICFPRSGTCMILLTNSDNGELAFRPLLEQLIGDSVTPWEWESYTRAAILRNEEHSPPK